MDPNPHQKHGSLDPGRVATINENRQKKLIFNEIIFNSFVFKNFSHLKFKIYDY